VKGFAFTLGMSTVLDLVIVFLFTHPIVGIAARSKRFSSPTWSGLGSVQRVAPPPAEDTAATRARAAARRTAAKES